VPGFPPVHADPDPLGIPGLDYMPPAKGGPPPRPGAHHRDRPRPWGWLAVAAALAVLAALGVAWTIGQSTDSPRRSPIAAPTSDPLAPVPPEPLPTDLLSPTAASSPSAPVSPTVPVTLPASTASRSETPSPGPRLVRVPDVVGDRRASAEARVREAGFAVAVQLAPAPSPRQNRRVIAQRPGGGQLALTGSTVTLVVANR
jgi:hypothetical protein